MTTKKPQKPVLEIVNNPKKPKPTKTGGGSGGSGSGRNAEKRFGKYAITNRSFHQIQPTKTGPVEIQLCNFICKIIEIVTHDDDLQNQTFLRIEGQRDDGFILPIIDIPNAKFISTHGNWVNEFWDMRAFIHPGVTIHSNLRAAIQLYSSLDGEIPRRHVYKYTGWKPIDGQWHYLTGSGAITADGLREDILVDLGPGHMSRYRLPAPMAGDDIKTAAGLITALLAICPGKPQIGAALLAAVARAPLGECHPIDFCLFIHGITGARKSAITAIALAFFGEFNARRFPANWTDTDNAMETKAFKIKNCVFVVDDYKPSVSAAEAAKLHARAERFIQNTGNQAGRGRLDSDSNTKTAPYNRSMTIITGEDLPRGQSLAGRLLILELTRADVDLAALTQLQQAAESGQLAGLMAGYIQWLAPRMDELKNNFPKIVTDLRNAAIRDGYATSHSRAPEIFANLVAAAEIFLEYLESSGAFDADQAAATLAAVENGLRQASGDQHDYQTQHDEVERFVDLLRALLINGNVHIANRLNQGPPATRPHAYGWRAVTDPMTEPEHKPMGNCIGWCDDTARELWLDQDSVYAEIQRLARQQGEAFLMTPGTLWSRLHQRGLILKTEPDPKRTRPRLRVKKTIAGVIHRVMVVSADLIDEPPPP